MVVHDQGAAQKDDAMNTSMYNDALALVGRALLAWLFIPAGWGKVMGFAGAVGYANSVGMPLPEVGVAVALVIELVGGIMLLIGFRTRCAAAALAFFTLVAAVMFHAYWAMSADQAMMQQIMFNKNLAIAGGLLAFVAFGAGAWSMDAKGLKKV